MLRISLRLRGISFVRVCATAVVPLAEVRASRSGSATMSEYMDILDTLSPLNIVLRKLSNKSTEDMCAHGKNYEESSRECSDNVHAVLFQLKAELANHFTRPTEKLHADQ